MSSAEAYAAAYPSCMLALGDLNGDGQVNTFDIDLFVDVMGGNLMSARRYQYDEENRLTAVAEIDGNPLLEIEYDALGRRIASTEYGVAVDPCTGDAGPVTVQTRHIYSGLNAVAEYISCDGGDWGLAREVLWGDRFPEPLALFDFTAAGDVEAGTEEVLHYVHDALGSVVGLVDAGDPDATPEPVPAKLVERYDYDPYGKTYIETWEAIGSGGAGAWMRARTSAYGNPFTWTGQRYDASVGMYHFPFRSFSPELGRWMQRDPLGYVNGISLYAYVLGNPLYWTDPLGLKIWWQPGRGSTPDDMDKAQRQLADARTRRNPDGSMGRGAQDIERLNQDEEGGVVVVVGPNDGNVAMKISNRVAVISHDPNREETYDDGVKRDPESALVHEMRHAARGIYGPKPKSERESETDAGSVENEHRRNKGEEQRRKYGDWPLEQHDVMPPVVAAPNPWLPLLLQAYHDAWLAWWRWRNFVGPLTPSERQEADEAYDEARRLDDLVKKWAPEALKPVICW